MSISHFLAGIAAAIWSPESEHYLLLHRSKNKDFGAGIWECLTGRVDQGEGFEQALHREIREELGVSAQAVALLGTTHFYRGATSAENELLGVVYLCTHPETETITLSREHSEYSWLTSQESLILLSASDPGTRWAHLVIERAEIIRPLLSRGILTFQQTHGFELG